MATQKPINHVEFILVGSPSNVVEYMNAHPEVRQLFRDGAKHAAALGELKDAGLLQRLQYVRSVCDAYEYAFAGDTALESDITLRPDNSYTTIALDQYVLDAYLAEDNWR